MKVTLPRMETISVDEIPADFRGRVQKAFAAFTAGTNPDYMYQDKLYYIDLCVEKLHKADAADDVDRMITEEVMYEVHEEGCLPSNEEVFGYEGLVQAYREGKCKHSLYSKEYGEDKHDDEKCMKLLIEIIKAVMEYERTES